MAAPKGNQNAKGNGGGRPTLYRKKHCQTVIDLGRQGYSKVMMADYLDVSRDTMNEWAKHHIEFSDALTRAYEYAQAWHERLAAEGLRQPTSEFNAALFGKIMSARFPDDYREKRDIEHSGKVTLDQLVTGSYEDKE